MLSLLHAGVRLTGGEMTPPWVKRKSDRPREFRAKNVDSSLLKAATSLVTASSVNAFGAAQM